MARRNSEHNLRQVISAILEQTYAIECAMDLYFRKGSERELARARDDLEIMRGAVDRLDALIETGESEEAAASKITESAA